MATQYASAGAGIAGGTLGGIGDIVQAVSHKKLKAPKAGKSEKRFRRASLQEMDNARRLLYSGAGLYDQSLPLLYNSIPGVQADVEYDPQAQEDYGKAYGDVQSALSLRDQLAAAKGAKRAAPKGADKKAAKANVKALKKTVKGAPSLDELNRALYAKQSGPPRLKITKKAPTQTDQNAQGIQDALSNRSLAALRGDLANPMLEKNLGLQSEQLEREMAANLGPDWRNSSLGIEATRKFDEYANAQRDQSNREDITTLYPEQLAGQRTGLTLAGMNQTLLTNPAINQVGMGRSLSDMMQGNAQAQQPYQFDRSMEFAASGANWQYGNPYGHALQQSGDRWIQAAGAMGGGGGGGSPGSMGSPSQSNDQIASDAAGVDAGY